MISDDLFDAIALIAFVGWIVYIIWQAIRKSRTRVSSGDSLLGSIVPENGVYGVALEPTKAGYPIRVFINDSTDSRVYYMVTMPFVSAAHLIGVPIDQSPMFGFDIDSGSVEKVQLEGDYNDYFALFVDTDDQVDARYVLDPAAMEFTLDFCRNFSWEIRENILYFASGENVVEFSVVDEFIRQIRPAIEKPIDSN